MSNQTKRQKFEILLPTAIGMIGYAIFAVICLVLSNYRAIQRTFHISSDLPSQVLQYNLRIISDVLTNIFGKSTADTIQLGIFWAIIGWGVYILIFEIQVLMSNFGHSLAETTYVRPKYSNRFQAIQEFFIKFLARIVILVVLVVYLETLLGYLFKNILGRHSAQNDLPTPPLTYFLLFGALLLLFHGLTILLRLLLLKKRLLG
jgi:hypothetical protein